MRFVVAWLGLAAAVAIATALLPGMDVDGGLGTYLWIAVLFALVNGILGTILRVLSLPLLILTLGLFSFIINGVLVLVTDWLSSSLEVDGFGTAILASVIISLVNLVVGLALRPATVMAE